jgi:hypothetical protein
MAGNEHEVNRSARDGKFVSESTVEAEPETTTTEHVGGKSGTGHEVSRSAEDGKFVSKSETEKNPATTETQQV